MATQMENQCAVNEHSEEEFIKKTALDVRHNRLFDIFDRENQLQDTTEAVHK